MHIAHSEFGTPPKSDDDCLGMIKERLIDLDTTQLDLLHTILNRHIPDKTVWAYGSRATWKAGETSDLDLAVFDCTPMEIYHLKDELEESDLLVSVDVMDWESIPESFREHIREKYVVVQEQTTRPEGWRELKLDELGEVITGKTPSEKNPEDWGNEMSFVTPSDYKNYGKFAYSGGRKLSNEGISKLRNKVLPSKSVMVTCIGSDMGKVAMTKFQVITNQQINSIVPNPKVVEPDFLYYFLVSIYNLLRVYGTEGTAVPILNKSDFGRIKIYLPPLFEQKAIAEVLSSLDDKIDLLHRQNKTLEAMAQALFRKWFVQGKDDTWDQGKLGEVFTVKGGTTPSTKEKNYWNGEINWTTPRDLSGHKAIFLLDTEKRITEQGLAKISSGLLPAGTVLLSSRAPVGYLAITDIDLAINQGYIAIVCDKILSNYFVYLWCKHNIEIIKKSSGGTVFQEIPKTVFREIDIAIPPKKLLSSFDQLVQPIFQKAKRNQYQIQKLENMRDALLPKLMNGEVKLIPAEKRDHGII